MTIKISEVFPTLTKRQREVCILLVRGYSSKYVARAHDISPRTVEDHRREILKNVGAISMAEVTFKLFGSPEVAL